MVDMAVAKQQHALTDEVTESDVDSDADDSLSLDSSPFASPRQPRAPQPLITSASAFELASLADDDSSSQYTVVCHKTHSHTHTRLTALFWDYPGEPVPER